MLENRETHRTDPKKERIEAETGVAETEADERKKGTRTLNPVCPPKPGAGVSHSKVGRIVPGPYDGGRINGESPYVVPPLDCSSSDSTKTVTPEQAKAFFNGVKNSCWHTRAIETRWNELQASIDRLAAVRADRDFIKMTKAEHGDDALSEFLAEREVIAAEFFSSLCWWAEQTAAALKVIGEAREAGVINPSWLDVAELYYVYDHKPSEIYRITKHAEGNQRKIRQRAVEALAKYIPRDMV